MIPQVPPADTGPATWKDGCPDGHVTTTRRHRKGGYYCDTCGQHYEGDPIPRGGSG
jgi:ribosomal protein L37AE/L43A